MSSADGLSNPTENAAAGSSNSSSDNSHPDWYVLFSSREGGNMGIKLYQHSKIEIYAFYPFVLKIWVFIKYKFNWLV